MKSLLRDLSRCLEERRQNIQEKNKKEDTPSNITQSGGSIILDFTTKTIF